MPINVLVILRRVARALGVLGDERVADALVHREAAELHAVGVDGVELRDARSAVAAVIYNADSAAGPRLVAVPEDGKGAPRVLSAYSRRA